jgi:hypothetical protein
MFPGLWKGHDRENHFYMCLYFFKKKNLQIDQQANFNQQLGTNNPLIKGIHNCINRGPGPLQREDNHKNAKMGWGHLEIFSRTTEPE